VIVLMVVRVIIGLSAMVPRAGSLFPQSPRALPTAQSHERKVRRYVHTRDRAQRQRFGAVMSAARREQTSENKHRGKAERSSEE
jgi:hypothetical protein